MRNAYILAAHDNLPPELSSGLARSPGVAGGGVQGVFNTVAVYTKVTLLPIAIISL